MKKIILFAIMMSSLLIACTMEKEPSLYLSAATAPEALMVASFVCLVYYEAQHLKIEQQYRDCLASAEDEE